MGDEAGRGERGRKVEEARYEMRNGDGQEARERVRMKGRREVMRDRSEGKTIDEFFFKFSGDR